jgi:[ribosomal protein S18]-alanine N-acetyltransferase
MIEGAAIRLAVRADAAAITAMSRKYIEYGLPWGWHEERVAAAIADPQTNVVVTGSRAAVIAFGIMSYLDDDAHLLLLAVRRAHQRRGIGSAILDWLEETARVAGAARIRVEARRDNVAARSFYNEHGYHELAIKRRMYSGVVDGIRLAKRLHSDT